MRYTKTRSMVLAALFCALIAVCSYIKIPVPGIPFTLQTLAVMLAGLLLGPFWGGAAAGLYLLLGLAGVPVFTEGGGLAYVLRPSFGYIVGFVIGAALGGWVARPHRKTAAAQSPEKADASAPDAAVKAVPREPTYRRLVCADLACTAAVYACGMTYYYLNSLLYLHTPMSVRSLFLYSFALVIPGDIVKSFLAAFIAKRLWKHLPESSQ